MPRGRRGVRKAIEPSGRAFLLLNVLLMALVPAWPLAYYFLLSPVWLLVGFALYTSILFLRSYDLFKTRLLNDGVKVSFRSYCIKNGVLGQNIGLGVGGGLSSLLPGLIVALAEFFGGLTLILAFDAMIITVIMITFFKRPWIGKTLSHSVSVNDRFSRLVEDLASGFGMGDVKLMVIPSHGSGKANASSWSLPFGSKYIFADSELFTALNMDEIEGIFMHELGHLKYRHSSKSYIYSSTLPLAWLNLLFLPFVLGIPYIDLMSAIVSVTLAVIFYRFGAGRLSRRFEKKADIFAAKNCDRDIYIRALTKLTYAHGNGGAAPTRPLRSSHLSLNERVKLIRSV